MNLPQTFLKMQRWPFGKQIFSLMVTVVAPYFRTIRPMVLLLQPGRCQIRMKKRWAVYNHIKTVHAIAMCNLCELTMGLAVEAGLSPSLRWIPKGMSVEYLKKGTTDLVSECQIENILEWAPGEHPVLVQVLDQNRQVVMKATIQLWITSKK